jgi:hypothetical protein
MLPSCLRSLALGDREDAALVLEVVAVDAERGQRAGLERLAEILREEPEEPEELDCGAQLRAFAEALRDVVPLLSTAKHEELAADWQVLCAAGNADGVAFFTALKSKKDRLEEPKRLLAAMDPGAVLALLPLMLEDVTWRAVLLETLEDVVDAGGAQVDALAAFLKRLRS